MICIFSIQGSRILRSFEFANKITSGCLIPAHVIKYNGNKVFDSCFLAVGTDLGKVSESAEIEDGHIGSDITESVYQPVEKVTTQNQSRKRKNNCENAISNQFDETLEKLLNMTQTEDNLFTAFGKYVTFQLMRLPEEIAVEGMGEMQLILIRLAKENRTQQNKPSTATASTAAASTVAASTATASTSSQQMKSQIILPRTRTYSNNSTSSTSFYSPSPLPTYNDHPKSSTPIRYQMDNNIQTSAILPRTRTYSNNSTSSTSSYYPSPLPTYNDHSKSSTPTYQMDNNILTSAMMDAEIPTDTAQWELEDSFTNTNYIIEDE